MHQRPHALIVIGALKSDFEIALLNNTPKSLLRAPTAASD
jgi:hypothetical protein